MKGQIIGKNMFHGYAGSYSRQPDMIVDTVPLAGMEELPFGAPVAIGTDGAAHPWAADSASADFWGVAVREVKSALDYTNQNKGLYRPGEAVSVMKRGCVNVVCQMGTPVLGGNVYIRTAADQAKPNAVVGGFEAAEDTGKNVKLTNAQWRGTADGNGVAELRILTMLNA